MEPNGKTRRKERDFVSHALKISVETVEYQSKRFLKIEDEV